MSFDSTVKKTIYEIVTNFIWLTASDIERMFYVGGWRAEPSTIFQNILELYRDGKLIRKGERGNYRYMRTPK